MVHLAAQIDVSEYSDSRKFVQRALQSSFIVAENCEEDHHMMMRLVMMVIIMMRRRRTRMMFIAMTTLKNFQVRS